MPKQSASTNQDLLTRLDERMKSLVELVAEFRKEYKEQTSEIKQRQDQQFGDMSKKQDDQFAAVIKRISDVETYQAMNLQPTRIVKWDQAAEKVDDYLDEKHIVRRERIFTLVERHLDEEGIESLNWTKRFRANLGVILAIGSGILGLLTILFNWFLSNVVSQFLGGK